MSAVVPNGLTVLDRLDNQLVAYVPKGVNYNWLQSLCSLSHSVSKTGYKEEKPQGAEPSIFTFEQQQLLHQKRRVVVSFVVK